VINKNLANYNWMAGVTPVASMGKYNPKMGVSPAMFGLGNWDGKRANDTKAYQGNTSTRENTMANTNPLYNGGLFGGVAGQQNAYGGFANQMNRQLYPGQTATAYQGGYRPGAFGSAGLLAAGQQYPSPQTQGDFYQASVLNGPKPGGGAYSMTPLNSARQMPIMGNWGFRGPTPMAYAPDLMNPYIGAMQANNMPSGVAMQATSPGFSRAYVPNRNESEQMAIRPGVSRSASAAMGAVTPYAGVGSSMMGGGGASRVQGTFGSAPIGGAPGGMGGGVRPVPVGFMGPAHGYGAMGAAGVPSGLGAMGGSMGGTFSQYNVPGALGGMGAQSYNMQQDPRRTRTR
jgi:hypothetical protein